MVYLVFDRERKNINVAQYTVSEKGSREMLAYDVRKEHFLHAVLVLIRLNALLIHYDLAFVSLCLVAIFSVEIFTQIANEKKIAVFWA